MGNGSDIKHDELVSERLGRIKNISTLGSKLEDQLMERVDGQP